MFQKLKRAIKGATETEESAARTVPYLTISPEEALCLGQEGSTLQTVSQRLADALSRPPFFTVLKGMPPAADRRAIENIAHAIAEMPPLKAAVTPGKRQKTSFTRVQINPAKNMQNGGSTNYSRTNLPLDLHTDSSYKVDPQDLVIFQMVRSATDGGDSLMVLVDDLVDQLTDADIATLQKPIFPLGKVGLPVLWKEQGAWHMRYYRTQIDTMVAQGYPFPSEGRKAVEALDDALQDTPWYYQFALEGGETLFLNNRRVLHGRTGFGPDSDRLMYRYRLYAGCLNAGDRSTL